MTRRFPALTAGALGLALALSACTPETSDDAAEQPAPETVTVTQTAPAPESTGSAEPSTGAGSEKGSEDRRDSSQGASEEPSESSSDSAKQETAGSDGLTSRGNIPKQVGEEARLTASSGEQALEFTVTGIQPDFQCTSPYAEAPENESFVKVDITASTGSAQDLEELFYSESMMFNPFEWKFVDSSGRTANEIGTMASYGCLDDSEGLPLEIGPGENVTGSLVLDVTGSSGTLIYKPVYDSAGWEWSL